MSQNHLNNGSSSSTHRDYGATSNSNTNMIGGAGAAAGNNGNNASIPDVNFSGFSPTEFMSLNEDISQNIQAINSSSKQLDKILQILGTPRDQQTTRDKINDIYDKANTCIETTRVDLQRLTAIVRRGDKQQKLLLEKLTDDFGSVVARYTSIQKRIASKMREILTQMQVQQMQQEQAMGGTTDGDREALVQRQKQLDQQQLQIEHDLLVDRERQIQKAEAQILDVNVIMSSIRVLVHAQHEQVERIETYVENAATEIEMGREQLSTAAGRRQSYRRKIVILLVIAVIIGLIITGIIVGKVNS